MVSSLCVVLNELYSNEIYLVDKSSEVTPTQFLSGSSAGFYQDSNKIQTKFSRHRSVYLILFSNEQP